MYERYRARCRSLLAFPSIESEHDALLEEMLNELFMDGEDLSMGNTLVAAVGFFLPYLSKRGGGRLPLTGQALRGWKVLCPPRSRLPLPWEVVALLVMELLDRGSKEIALCLLVTFELYLRPGEPHKLRVADLIRPLSEKTGRDQYAFVLNPIEVGVPSKTGEFDDALLLDLPRHQAVGPAVHEMLLERFGAALNEPLDRLSGIGALPLFSCSQLEVSLAVAQVDKELNLAKALGKLHMHRVRHSSASHDYLVQARSLVDIRRRGRWKSFASVRRYEKSGRVAELLQKLPADLRNHAVSCGDLLYEVVAAKLSPLKRPLLSVSSSTSTVAAKALAKRGRKRVAPSCSGTSASGMPTTFADETSRPSSSAGSALDASLVSTKRCRVKAGAAPEMSGLARRS
jgi:hypothetical protein